MQPVLAPHPACASSPRIHPCFFFRGSTLSSQLACHPAGRSLCRWNFAHVVRHADQKSRQYTSTTLTSSPAMHHFAPAILCRHPSQQAPNDTQVARSPMCWGTFACPLGGTWSGKSDRCPAMPASPSGACWSWAICKASPSANGLG